MGTIMVGIERRAAHHVPQLRVRDALTAAHDQRLELRQLARRPLDDRARRQRDVERLGVHVRRRDLGDCGGVLALDLAQDLGGEVAHDFLGLAVVQLMAHLGWLRQLRLNGHVPILANAALTRSFRGSLVGSIAEKSRKCFV